MTILDMITASMQEIGAIAAGEPVAAADAQVALVRFNGMLDLWQSERLTIYNLDREVFSFVTNQQSYTIGPAVGITTADWTYDIRPLWIQHAGVIWTASGIETEIPMKILTDDEWAATRVKAVSSTLPTYLYYNPTFPWGTLYFWPYPTDNTVDVALYLPLPMQVVSALTTVLVLPPGYEEALRYNLAVRLAPVFGRTIDPTVAALAIESKAQIKRKNIVADPMRCDPAVIGEAGAFNIFSGGM